MGIEQETNTVIATDGHYRYLIIQLSYLDVKKLSQAEKSLDTFTTPFLRSFLLLTPSAASNDITCGDLGGN